MNTYKNLKNHPLTFVLAEFRFSTIMDIGKYIPAFQDQLRKQYPEAIHKKDPVLDVKSNELSVLSTDKWEFVSADKKNALSINQQRLIYYTSDYNGFDDFYLACSNALNILNSTTEPTLISRVGLRYSDLVVAGESESITDLVDPHFTFADSLFGLGEAIHKGNESILKTDLGWLVIRTLYGKHRLSILPDIPKLPIIIKELNDASERIVLDFDHYWESKNVATNFDVNEILSKLSKLHKASRQAFWQITTDYARDKKWI